MEPHYEGFKYSRCCTRPGSFHLKLTQEATACGTICDLEEPIIEKSLLHSVYC